jgi:hypothetical protein
MAMRPVSAASTPRIILIVVVLPAPFGPSRPTISLRRTAKEMPSTACEGPNATVIVAFGGEHQLAVPLPQRPVGDPHQVEYCEPDPDQTLIVSTHRHNMLSICDRLIVIDAGRILADGPRDEVLGRLTAAVKLEEAQ